MNCPECHKPTHESKVLDDTAKGAVISVHHICPCGWDDFPDCGDLADVFPGKLSDCTGADTADVRKAVADFLRDRKPRHQAPPEIET